MRFVFYALAAPRGAVLFLAEAYRSQECLDGKNAAVDFQPPFYLSLMLSPGVVPCLRGFSRPVPGFAWLPAGLRDIKIAHG